jgi:hypothetical protein
LEKPVENAASYQHAIDRVIELAGEIKGVPASHNQKEVSQKPKPKPKPNVIAKRGNAIWATDDSHNRFFEVPIRDSTSLKTIVAEFRYEPHSNSSGDPPVWYDVQASISYLNEAGYELLHVGKALWLGYEKFTVKFPLFENRYLVIAVQSHRGAWSVNDDGRICTVSTDTRAAKIVLHDDNGVVLPSFILSINLDAGAVGPFMR